LLPGQEHALIHVPARRSLGEGVVGRTRNAKENQMKTTRMTVEGAKGWANITRGDDGGRMVINIHGDGAAGLFDFNADTRDHPSQERAAARLQRELDGYQGTAGDVADYLRAIQTFAD
jgi:hypothetical protein